MAAKTVQEESAISEHGDCGVKRRRALTRLLVLAVLLFGSAGASGCGLLGKNDRANQVTGRADLFRTPRPTFTPTAPSDATTPVVQASQPAEPGAAPRQDQALPPSEPEPSVIDAPSAVVNAPLVNLRSGPGLDTVVVAMVERGAEFDVVGRSGDGEWWQVCCQEGQTVWIARELVDTDGAVDSVPIGDAVGAPAAPQPQAVAPGLGGSVADEGQFSLVAKEQFQESNLVRVYAFVYDGVNALAGYSIRVTKDGREMPVSAQSFGGQPAFTWPFQDARQRFQNLKIEFPGESPKGVWTVQLTDSQGRPVGPLAEFTLGDNDPNQELYVRYERSN